MDRREAIARVVARVFFEAVELSPDDERRTTEELVDEHWESDHFLEAADEILALFPDKPQPLAFL